MFRDDIAFRYGWEPRNLPSKSACDENLVVTHAMRCARGGFTHVRHNEIRDTFAELLDEICFDVEMEPILQPLQGKPFQRNQRALKMTPDLTLTQTVGISFKSYFDVKIFNPLQKFVRKTLTTIITSTRTLEIALQQNLLRR